MEIWTLEKLKETQPGQILARGIDLLPNTNPTEFVKWFAVRGTVQDWCIYYASLRTLDSDVLMRGKKLLDEYEIRKLVPCNDKFFKVYRR